VYFEPEAGLVLGPIVGVLQNDKIFVLALNGPTLPPSRTHWANPTPK